MNQNIEYVLMKDIKGKFKTIDYLLKNNYTTLEEITDFYINNSVNVDFECDIDFFNEYKDKGLNIFELTEKYINSGNKSEFAIFKLAKIPGANISVIEDYFILIKDFYHLNLLAQSVPGANLKKIEKAIIDGYSSYEKWTDRFLITSDIEILCNLTIIDGANIEAIEDLVIKLATLDSYIEFVKRAANINFKKLEDAYISKVKKTNAKGFAYVDFVCSVPNADVKKFENVILQAKDYDAAYEFATRVKDANVGKLVRFIIDGFQKENALSKGTYYVYLKILAKHVQGKDLELVINEILRISTPIELCQLAVFNKFDSKIAEKALIKAKDGESIRVFAANIPTANIEALEDVEIKHGDTKNLVMFAVSVPKSNIDKIENELQKRPDAMRIIDSIKKDKSNKKILERLAKSIRKNGVLQDTKDISYVEKFLMKFANKEEIDDKLFAKNFKKTSETIRKICTSDSPVRFKAIDYLLERKLITLEELISYYIKNYTNYSLEFFYKYKDKLDIFKITNQVLSTDELTFILAFAKIPSANISAIEDYFIGKKNLRFLSRIPHINVNKVEQAIIEQCKDIEKSPNKEILEEDLITLILLTEIKGINISIIEDIVIKYGNVFDYINFIRNVSTANISKFEDGLIAKTEKSYYAAKIYWRFVVGVPRANMEKFENAILKTKDLDIICRCFAKQDGANVKRIINFVLNEYKKDKENKKDVRIYSGCFVNLAQVADKEDLEILTDALISSDSDFITHLATIPGINLEKIENVVVERKYVQSAFAIAYNVPTANIEKLEDVVIKFGSVYEIMIFALVIPSANLDVIINELLKRPDALTTVRSIPIDDENLAQFIKEDRKATTEAILLNIINVLEFNEFNKKERNLYATENQSLEETDKLFLDKPQKLVRKQNNQ